jgi:hypothetical protein
VPEDYVMERKLMEIFIMRCQLITDKVSVLDVTRLRQGQFGNRKGKDI